MTHIRTLNNEGTMCGLMRTERYGTISFYHFEQSFREPAIHGHISRFPQPLCELCKKNAIVYMGNE